MRFLGMNDFGEIDRMTLYEYDMRMTAHRLAQVDREYEIHLQAWCNWNVQAMKSQGKRKRVPMFKTFKQFFDYDKEVQEVLGKADTKESKKKQGMASLLKKQKERRAKDGDL